jgi:hypothetical protein
MSNEELLQETEKQIPLNREEYLDIMIKDSGLSKEEFTAMYESEGAYDELFGAYKLAASMLESLFSHPLFYLNDKLYNEIGESLSQFEYLGSLILSDADGKDE